MNWAVTLAGVVTLAAFIPLKEQQNRMAVDMGAGEAAAEPAEAVAVAPNDHDHERGAGVASCEVASDGVI